MIMGSRVQIRLGARFDILRFVRTLLFPFLKNIDVDERGYRLRFFHARRRGVVESFSIHTHEVSGSTLMVQVTVYLYRRIIPVFLVFSFFFFFFGGGGGGKLLSFWVTTPRIRKRYVFYFLAKFLIGQVSFPNQTHSLNIDGYFMK